MTMDTCKSVIFWNTSFGEIWSKNQNCQFKLCDVNFFCFGPEIPFLGKFVLKIQSCLKWNLVLRLIWICRIHWWCLFFLFLVAFLVKFGSKKWNWQFKLKFGTQFNSNMQNSMLILTFCFWSEILFLGNLVQKIANCQFKLKFCT